MDSNGLPRKDPDWELFARNRSHHTLEQLAPFERQHVAWSLDGTQILVSGADVAEVYQKMAVAGIRTDQAVLDFIDPFDEGQL